MRDAPPATALLTAALAVPAGSARATATHDRSSAMSTERATTVSPRTDAWEAKVLRLTNARRRAHRVLNPDLHRVGVAGRRVAEGRTYAAQNFIG